MSNAASAIRREIAVSAPARLHLGFMDLNGSLGRRFGSIGLALEAPSARVRAIRRTGNDGHGVVVHDHARSSDGDRSAATALRHAHALLGRDVTGPAVDLHLDALIPAHAGLGSGTQLALAVGTALARLVGQPAGARALAARLERGSRSGIGVAAFEQGGFVVDGGRHEDAAAPPPLIARHAFPARWRILLVRDGERTGVHGDREKRAFEALGAFPDAQAAHLCRVVMMRMLPALAEGDAAGFGSAVTEVQRRVGDHFAHAQGGRFASPAVTAALALLERSGAAGIGQSSWGPTGFAICESEGRANALAAMLRERNADASMLRVSVHAARNTPGDVTPPGEQDARAEGAAASPRDATAEAEPASSRRRREPLLAAMAIAADRQ